MQHKELKKWKILNSYYALKSKYLTIRRDQVLLPDGSIDDEYYVQEKKGWVTILCFTEDEHIILTRQYKHGIGRVVLELPAGSVDESTESPEDAVRRELEEETGYKADRIDLVAEFIIDPTFSNGWVWIFLGRNARPIGQCCCDPKEIIETELVTLPELISKLRSGEINVLGHVASIYTVLDKLQLL